MSKPVSYQILKAVKLCARVLAWHARGRERRETAHQFSVIEDPSYLVPSERTLKRDSVPAAGVVVEVDSDSLDWQTFTLLQQHVKFTKIKGTATVPGTLHAEIPLENLRIALEMEGSALVHRM